MYRNICTEINNLGAGWPLKNFAATKITIICLLIIVKHRWQLLASLAFISKSLHLPMALTPYIDFFLTFWWMLEPAEIFVKAGFESCCVASWQLTIFRSSSHVPHKCHTFSCHSISTNIIFSYNLAIKNGWLNFFIDNKGISLIVKDLNFLSHNRVCCKLCALYFILCYLIKKKLNLNKTFFLKYILDVFS